MYICIYTTSYLYIFIYAYILILMQVFMNISKTPAAVTGAPPIL